MNDEIKRLRKEIEGFKIKIEDLKELRRDYITNYVIVDRKILDHLSSEIWKYERCLANVKAKLNELWSEQAWYEIDHPVLGDDDIVNIINTDGFIFGIKL